MAFSPNKDSNKVVIMADSAGKFYVSSDQLKEWENDYVYLRPFGSYDSQRPRKTWDPLGPPEFNFHVKLKDPFEAINRLFNYKEFIYPLPDLMNEKKDTPDLFASGVNSWDLWIVLKWLKRMMTMSVDSGF
jgi:hypothetical protein